MNEEARRQIEEAKARRARMGAPVTPKPAIVSIREIASQPASAKPKRLRNDVKPVITRADLTPHFTGSRSHAIIDELCVEYQVYREDLLGKARPGYLVRARQHAYYRVYAECRHLSLSQIGKLFDRDHSTCLHGIRVHMERHGLTDPRKLGEAA